MLRPLLAGVFCTRPNTICVLSECLIIKTNHLQDWWRRRREQRIDREIAVGEAEPPPPPTSPGFSRTRIEHIQPVDAGRNHLPGLYLPDPVDGGQDRLWPGQILFKDQRSTGAFNWQSPARPAEPLQWNGLRRRKSHVAQSLARHTWLAGQEAALVALAAAPSRHVRHGRQ